MDFLPYLNPLTYATPGKYFLLWQTVFGTILSGFWSRVLAALFLFMAFWFGVRKQRIQRALMFFLLAAAMTYGAGFLMLFGLFK